MERTVAAVAVRTGIAPNDLLETDLPILDEIVRLLIEEQRRNR